LQDLTRKLENIQAFKVIGDSKAGKGTGVSHEHRLAEGKDRDDEGSSQRGAQQDQAGPRANTNEHLRRQSKQYSTNSAG